MHIAVNILRIDKARVGGREEESRQGALLNSRSFAGSYAALTTSEAKERLMKRTDYLILPRLLVDFFT